VIFFVRIHNFVLLLLLSSLLACTSTMPPPVNITAEQRVAIRAQERWDALKARQYEKAFTYLSPSMRETLPFEVFRGRISGASWIDVRVTKATCDAEVCDVVLRMDYYVLQNLKDSQQIEEKWFLERGEWWIVYRG
jgi:hypothetical protein